MTYTTKPATKPFAVFVDYGVHAEPRRYRDRVEFYTEAEAQAYARCTGAFGCPRVVVEQECPNE